MARRVSPGWTRYSQSLVVTVTHSPPAPRTPAASPQLKHHCLTLPSSPGRAVTDTRAVVEQRSGLDRLPALHVTAAPEATNWPRSRPMSSGGSAPLRDMLAMLMTGTPWKVVHCRLADRLSPTVRAQVVAMFCVSGLQTETGPVTCRNMDTMLE